MITLHLLGPFELQGGERIPALRRKERALLAYLVAANQAHSRRALVDMFCQAADVPERALRLLLSRIRHEVHPQVVLSDGDKVRFNPQVGRVDFLEFVANLDRDPSQLDLVALEKTVELYRGEFLDGLDLADAPEFDLWLLSQRARLRHLYERGLSELVARWLAARKYEAAIHRAQQLVQSNPLLEEGHARLMWLYAQTGQREAALAQFTHIRDLLRRELAVEPMPDLVALRDAVALGRPDTGFKPRVQTISNAQPLPQAANFVGREAELGRLFDAWQAAQDKQGGVILVEAQAGGGKTRLVQELGRTLPDGCFLHGRCYESTQALPYRPWIEVLEARLAKLDDAQLARHSPLTLEYLIRLVPALVRRLEQSHAPAIPMARGDLERLFTAVADCLSQSPGPGEPAALLVFLDDMQWADETSLRLFHFLAQRVGQTRLLLIGAFRSEEVEDAPALQTLLHDLARLPTHRLFLPPLTSGAINSLIIHMWSLLPEGYRSHVAGMLSQATGGNPLFVTEVLSDLAHMTEAPTDLPVPASVRDLVHHRLRRLPESSRQVVEALAVLHGPASLLEAQQISGRSEDETAQAIDLGLRRGLLQAQTQTRPTRYDFHHDLVREAVVGRVSQVRRELLHRRAAHTLEQAGARAALLAYHWGMAGDTAQEGHYAALAGEQAATVYANDEAVRYLERALELLHDTERRFEVMRVLGEVWMLTGKWQAAETVFRQALALAHEADHRQWQARFQHKLGILLSRKGLYPQALDYLAQARDTSEALGDRATLANSIGTMGIVSYLMDDYDTAIACYEQALQIDTELGNQAGSAVWVANLGNVYDQRGAYAEALRYYERALNLHRALGSKLWIGIATGNIGNAYRALGDYHRALTHHMEALQIRHELGDQAGIATVLGDMGLDYEKLDAFDAAQTCYQRALHIDLTLDRREGIARHMIRLGGVLDRLGRDNASAWLEHGLALGRQLGTSYYVGAGLAVQTRQLLTRREYRRAQAVNAETLRIAVTVDKEMEFEARLRAIHLQVALDELSVAAALETLLSLLHAEATPLQQAAILYEIWRLDRACETERQAATALYRELWEGSPSIEYRLRYEELTGETLPDPPPPPPLPDIVTASSADLETLLDQVKQLIASPITS